MKPKRYWVGRTYKTQARGIDETAVYLASEVDAERAEWMAVLEEAREVLEWTEDDDWWAEHGFEHAPAPPWPASGG